MARALGGYKKCAATKPKEGVDGVQMENSKNHYQIMGSFPLRKRDPGFRYL